MSLRSTIRTVRSVSGSMVRSCAVLILLGLYVAGNTSFGIVHELFHAQKPRVVQHSPAQEKDPCHRSIYHVDKRNQCSHQTHFSVHEDCDQCDHHFFTDQLIFRTTTAVPVMRYITPAGDAVPIAVQAPSFHISARAPPFC